MAVIQQTDSYKVEYRLYPEDAWRFIGFGYKTQDEAKAIALSVLNKYTRIECRITKVTTIEDELTVYIKM